MSKGRPRKGAQKEKVVLLNVHPPADQIVRKTNQLVYLSRTIMHALVRHDESWPFLELITPRKIDIPNYYDIVTQPMSLRVVKKRLMNNYYWSAVEAIQDISLVFENAYRVTEPLSVLSRMARNVETLFYAHLQALPQPEIEIGPDDNSAARLRSVRIPHFPHDMKNNVDEQCVTSSDAVVSFFSTSISILTHLADVKLHFIANYQKIEPMDIYHEHDENGGNDEMMEFALRRLERFFGIDRSPTYNSWVHPSSYAEMVIHFHRNHT